MSLTLSIYNDDDSPENKTKIHLGGYLIEENSISNHKNIRLNIYKKYNGDNEKIVNNLSGNRFFSEFSKKNGNLKLMIGENPHLFIKTEGLYLLKDKSSEYSKEWDILRGEFVIGMKKEKRSLFVLDIFYQNESEFSWEEHLYNFRDTSIDNIIFAFQWNDHKNRIDFMLVNKINNSFVKISFDIKQKTWLIKDNIKLGLSKLIDVYLYNDQMIFFTQKGIYNGNSDKWIMKVPEDYRIKKIYKSVNSNQIILDVEYKSSSFKLRQIYIYNTIGNYYYRVELNIDLFSFNAFFFRHQWICRFESPIAPPIWVSEIYNKKSFFIPISSSSMGNLYEEKKDYIEYRKKKMKYIMFKTKNISSSVYIFLSSCHLEEIDYSDDLFKNKTANDKMIYPSYVFTKPEWIIKIKEHFRQMLKLSPNQILIEQTKKEDISTKLTETVDYFLVRDVKGSIYSFDTKTDEFVKKYSMSEKDMKYNHLLDVFLDK